MPATIPANSLPVGYITTTRLGEKGQLTVPKEFRDELGLKPGAPVSVLRIGEGLVLVPEQDRFELLCANISNAFRGMGVSAQEAVAMLPQIREELFDERYPGLRQEMEANQAKPKRGKK